MTPAPAEAEKNTKNVTDSNSLKRLRYIFAALLSALFLAAPYHFPGAWPLAFIAFLPALFMLRGHTSSFAFKLFFLMGFFYYLLTGYWLCYVNIFGFVLLALYLALYFGIFGSLSCSFLASGQLRASLTVAALWTLLEYTRGYLLSGFPWALLGYSQWKNLPIIQIADVVGAFGVSFFVMWVNVMLFSAGGGPASGGKIYRSRNILVLTVVFLSVWTYGFFTLRSREAFYTDGLSKAKLSVAVLQGNIPQEEKWDARIKTIIFEKYKRLTLMAAMEKPDLIVWPETSFPGYLEDEVVMAAHLRSTARSAHTHLLVGAPTVGDLETVQTMKFYNSAVFFTPKGEEVSRYHKMHLVPFGEYVPFEHLIGFIRNFVTIGRFSPGDKQTLFSIATEHQPIRIAAKFGVLICYEDIFPGKVREMCKNGADFLVNISNDAWFGKTSAPYQHAQASVFRAVENRVPVVRSTNTGLSCFITSEGRITASVKKDGEELMVSGRQAADVILRRGRPFFTRYGDLFFWLILGWLIFAYRDKHKKSGYSRA